MVYNVSLLLLFNPSVQARAREVAREVAAQTDEDLERLREVVEDAAETKASPAELADRLNRDVPRASKIAPLLLQQGGMPLAAWLTFLVALITLLLQLRAQHPGTAIPPEKVEQIVQRVVQEVNEQARESKLDPRSEPSSRTRPDGARAVPHRRP
jgi:hypothetical protein